MIKERRLPRRYFAAAVLATALLLAGCVSGNGGNGGEGEPAPTEDADALENLEPMTLRVAYPFPDTGTPGTIVGTWMEEVEERTDGKVTFEAYPNASLIPGAEVFAGLASGLTDVGFFAASNQPNDLPIANWVLQLTTPVTGDLGYPMSNLAGYPASAGIFTVAEPLVEEVRARGIEPMLHMYSAPFMMICSEPVETTADAEGKSIRTGGQPWQGEVEALGMTNVFLPTPELYEALERGVIDCAMLAADNVATLGLTEVTSATTLLNAGASAGAQFGINKDKWDSFPPELQQIMREAAGPAHAAFMRDTFEVYKAAIEAAQDQEHTFPAVEALNAVIAEQRAGVLDSVMANPPAGVEDPEAILEQYEAYTEEWVDFVESELAVESIDPAEATSEELVEAYLAGGDDIDWDAYEAKFEEFLAGL